MQEIFRYKTKLKIGVARVLYRFIKIFFKKDKHKIKRDGIFFEVDLREGIDLSLFLFGGFQHHIISNQFFKLKPNATVFDVGANCGVMSLCFAKAATKGHVYSFEPTHYAFKKLLKNLELNPGLASRVTTVQAFVSEKELKQPNLQAYSSWKVDSHRDKKVHPVHLGTFKATKGVTSVNLDSFCMANRIKKIDFIKIDTDGHEAEVLKGATKSIAKYRPSIVFEVGDYLLKEKGLNFEFFLNYFQKLQYSLIDIGSQKKITRRNYCNLIPTFSTTDILAIPRKGFRQNGINL